MCANGWEVAFEAMENAGRPASIYVNRHQLRDMCVFHALKQYHQKQSTDMMILQQSTT